MNIFDIDNTVQSHDLKYDQNLIINGLGAFYHPKMVLIDPETLRTLPKRFVNDGMGEVIKYGCK